VISKRDRERVLTFADYSQLNSEVWPKPCRAGESSILHASEFIFSLLVDFPRLTCIKSLEERVSALCSATESNDTSEVHLATLEEYITQFLAAKLMFASNLTQQLLFPELISVLMNILTNLHSFTPEQQIAALQDFESTP